MKLSLSPETERLIAEKISSGRYRSADEVVREGLKLLPASEQDTAAPKTLGDLVKLVEEITSSIPDSAWDKVPPDLAENVDHYLYGTKKQS